MGCGASAATVTTVDDGDSTVRVRARESERETRAMRAMFRHLVKTPEIAAGRRRRRASGAREGWWSRVSAPSRASAWGDVFIERATRVVRAVTDRESVVARSRTCTSSRMTRCIEGRWTRRIDSTR